MVLKEDLILKEDQRFLYSEGDNPVAFLKARLKVDLELKPQSKAILSI